MTDPITEADLHAYIDGQLDVARRVDVEGYLAHSPTAAARVMADLHARDALGMALGAPLASRPSASVMDAARRLERGLAWRRVASLLRRVASVAFLVGAGWLAHAQGGAAGVADGMAAPALPAFVEDARHAHETALIRARMASQRGAPDYDPVEIRAETGIALPALPGSWRVINAQVFPSRLGHSVELEVDDPALGRASLFAARSAIAAAIAPTLVRPAPSDAPGHTASPASGAAIHATVYWQQDQDVFALTGTAPDGALERVAVGLSAASLAAPR